MAGRSKGSKYGSKQQAQKARTDNQFKGRYYFLTIPALPATHSQLSQQQYKLYLKQTTRDALVLNQQQRGLQHFYIALETHLSGELHLHAYLSYKKAVRSSFSRFNYLIKHPNVTKVRNLQQAVSYLTKQDKQPLVSKGFKLQQQLYKKQLKQQPYQVLQRAMLQQPFTFNAHSWLRQRNLDLSIVRSGWSLAISLIKQQQQAECNRRLADKLGFKLITPAHIRTCMTYRQHRKYRQNHTLFDKIVTKINQICQFGCNRPFKSKHLLLVGPPNTGKTSLARQIQKHTSVYYKGVSNWFPSYRSHVYKMILWNQFNLKSMSHPQLLNFLQGSYMDLQYKGGSTLKTDNQLIFMTSNMSLSQHINSRFKSPQSRALAEANLRARIQQVILPQGVDLFLLQKLITSGIDQFKE